MFLKECVPLAAVSGQHSIHSAFWFAMNKLPVSILLLLFCSKICTASKIGRKSIEGRLIKTKSGNLFLQRSIKTKRDGSIDGIRLMQTNHGDGQTPWGRSVNNLSRIVGGLQGIGSKGFGVPLHLIKTKSGNIFVRNSIKSKKGRSTGGTSG